MEKNLEETLSNSELIHFAIFEKDSKHAYSFLGNDEAIFNLLANFLITKPRFIDILENSIMVASRMLEKEQRK